MKYFTPERLVRLQDHSDKKRFLAALDDWDNALERYRKHLQKIHGQLPGSLRKFLGSVSLHDALIVDMWQRPGRFNITLFPDADPSKLVVLGYSLVESPHIDRKALPEGIRSEQVAWLYDELAVPQSPSNGRGRATFAHRILLSNGWEVCLRFRSMTVTRPDPLVPAALEAGIGPASVSRSA